MIRLHIGGPFSCEPVGRSCQHPRRHRDQQTNSQILREKRAPWLEKTAALQHTTLASNSGNKVAGQAPLVLCPPTWSPTEHEKAHLRQLHVPRFPFTTKTTVEIYGFGPGRHQISEPRIVLHGFEFWYLKKICALAPPIGTFSRWCKRSVVVSFLPLTWFSFAQSPQTVQSAHLWDKEERVPHAALQFIYPARVLHAATRIFLLCFCRLL